MKTITKAHISFMILTLIVACGNNPSSQNNAEGNTNISVSVPLEKAIFSKLGDSPDLDITSMIVEIKKNDVLYTTKALSKNGNLWETSVLGLEKTVTYTFNIIAKNISEVIIFTGSVSHTITDVNVISISLEQIESIPNSIISIAIASNLATTQESFSFDIANPTGEEVTWRILDDNKNISDEFTNNQGSTTETLVTINLTYAANIAGTHGYILELSNQEGLFQYAFDITTIETGDSSITVYEAPTISQLNVEVNNDTLTLTPIITPNINLTYKWEILEGADTIGTIIDVSIEKLTLSNYSESSTFTLKLTVTNSQGSSSYQKFKI